MKLLGAAILAITLVVALAEDSSIHHNGQPGCKTDEEVRVQKYRNNWDPTAYWVCSTKNAAAVEKRCDTSLLFSDQQKTCIAASDWVWTAPVEPPSRP